ncbi:MAG: serine/threonine-protein kinase, partial [Candidatus Promineifilaceae bacterium]
MRNLIGQQIASYQIQTMAGEGAIGSVYQAIELGSGSLVAVKLVHSRFEQRVRDLLLEQARQSQRLAHGGIVSYYEASVIDGNVCLVSELLPLGSLAQRLVELRYRGEALPLAVVLGMVLQLAEGLHAAHEMGVVHGHLSMENVLLANEQTVKINDFGLWLPSLIAADRAAWTYAAPEQLQGAQGDLLSDVYALGVLFYELVVGEPPFAPNSFDEAKQMHGEEEPEEPRSRVADLPSLINEIILHMLEKEPEDRPTNLLDVIQTIQFATDNGPNDAVALVAGTYSAENDQTQFDVTDGIDAALVEFNDQWGADEDRVTISRTPPI